MKHLLLICCTWMLLTSCAEKNYNIAGNTNVEYFDGRMLYLRVPDVHTHAISDVDSCRVVHGRFDFMGSVDSVVMAQLFVEKETIMPVVLEHGDLFVEVTHGGQRVQGGRYNEMLYNFLRKKNKIEYKLWEVDQEFMQLMRQGKRLEDIQQQLGKKSAKLNKEMEELETKFIIENHDNPLGAGYFMLLFSQYPLPMMNSQLQNIIHLAPKSFLSLPLIDSYIRKAKANEALYHQP